MHGLHEKFRSVLWDIKNKLDGVVKVGSICTGMGTMEMVLSHLERVWSFVQACQGCCSAFDTHEYFLCCIIRMSDHV